MGDPAFKIRDIIKRDKVAVFSSNYALYGSFSAKVLSVLLFMVPAIENYSIDESFLNLGEFREREVEPLARELRERVQRWVGIPTCVGIAPQRHLPRSPTSSQRSVYSIAASAICVPVRCGLICSHRCRSMVWGMGAASAAKLAKIGVKTAADLAALDPDNARALMTVTGGRTVYELRGISCLPLEQMEPTRKGIAVTSNSGLRSRPGGRCARPSQATPREQRRRCAATKWRRKISSCLCTQTPSTTIRST